MKIQKKHIHQIQSDFRKIETKEDLLALLNKARRFMYGKDVKLIRIKSLTYYANPQISTKRYKSFTIKKKSGGDRQIHAPVAGLKSILRALNFVLQCLSEPHAAATGFIREKSIVDNAARHLNKHYVFNIDLKDFFHSFDRNRVKLAFMYAPFNLRDEKEPLAFLLASLSTHPFQIDGETRIVLPQGSPVSPVLTNIMCRKLDHRLNGLARRFGLTYTRYADDITFSSNRNVFNSDEFKDELYRIIEDDQKLKINPAKTRLQKSVYRQEVTGLIVNEKVNVNRRYIDLIRKWLYYWERYGYEKAESIFRKMYFEDKGHVKPQSAKFENVLEGKLLFLKMVKGEEDSTYRKLWKRFVKLNGKTDPFDEILDIWEKEGIEEAMDVFYGDFLEIRD